jgi:probable DNA repair protein
LSPYNISGGISLANAPVVAIALRLLRWLIEPVHHSEVESLLRSPFFELEAFAAQSQNGSLPESYNAAKLVHRFGMTRLREVVGTTTAKNATLAEQILRLKSALELAGWPNASKLTSESFQAYRGFLDLLNELAAASSIVRNLTFAEGLAAVQGAARRALFAPMRPDAPLQVLGYLETAHLRFTHLWVVGLSDLNWPGPARPSVYIPLRLLRGAGVPRVDTDSELAFARRLTEHWCRAAPVVIFSNPNTVDDSVCRTSRLAGASSPTRYAAAPYPHSHPFLVRASHAALEIQDESAAGPLVVANLRHRGSQIIRDQSACPFRAFARYRLHAMQRTLPHSFFDLADRGVATHLALHGAHERIRQFGDVDELQLSTKVADAVASALSVYDHFPVSFLASEHKRLTALVLEWLYFERERLQGALIASERPTSLTLGAFEFQLQIDRIDELESGGMLVIDYKTGASNPLAVLGERPEEPQLAMYALSVANVQAIAFARVKHDDCRIVGWSNPSRAGHAATERYLRPPPPQGQTWAAVLDAWRTTLTHLSNEFMGGVADVSPRSAATCRQCDLHAVCRIRETGPAGADVLDN